MCGPAVGFLASAAQAGVGFMAESAQASAQNAAWKQNYKNSIKALGEDYTATTRRIIQEDIADNAKLGLSQVEGAEKAAEAEVSAAAGGVDGNSVKSVVNNILRKAATNRAVIEENNKMKVAQLMDEMKGHKAKAESRIASVQPAASPSPLGAMISVVSSGIKAFG
ncbi:hypothetical protein [Aestuariivirga sp.]|uniref:virion core protein, T7 gp14 family n=1 Tax=Aestuariivirga sp. TaxID=2650926 RepID=UPI0039E5C060